MLKVTLIFDLSYLLLRQQIQMLPQLMDFFDRRRLFSYLGTVMIRMLAGIRAVYHACALAAADYFYQRWDLEREMRMTKQEVKEEVKSREGDPMIKARIKRIQREVASRRMMEEIPKADVIMTLADPYCDCLEVLTKTWLRHR